MADGVLGRRARGLRVPRDPSCGEVFAATGWRLRESLSPGIQVSAPVRGERGPAGALTPLFRSTLLSDSPCLRRRRRRRGVASFRAPAGTERRARVSGSSPASTGAAKGRREALTTGKKECLSIRLPEAISHVGTGGSLPAWRRFWGGFARSSAESLPVGFALREDLLLSIRD